MNSFVVDFSDVAIESAKTIRSNPTKSAMYATFGTALYGFYKTNPDQRHFTEQLRQKEQLVSLVSSDSQNPQAVSHLKLLVQNQNSETLRITSIGFFSIMWIDDNAEGLSTYDAVCEYLQPELRTFHERIIDIGWLDRWWNLEKKMNDFDVNF